MSWQTPALGSNPPERSGSSRSSLYDRPAVPAHVVSMQRQADSLRPGLIDYWPDAETLSPTADFYLALAHRLYEQDGHISPVAQQILEAAGVLVVELGGSDMPYYGFVALSGAGVNPAT